MLAACSADEAPTVIDPTADGAVSAADVAPPNDRADPLFDGGTRDGSADGTAPNDLPRADGATGDAAVGDAGATSDGATGVERCNGLDDDGDGAVDEGCACTPGMTQRCYPGAAATRMRGACADGMQRCEGTGEFGSWGMCAGAVVPADDVCGDRVDNDCNGTVDDGPTCCRAGDATACYTGPEGTRGRGVCRDGRSTCNADGTPGACTGQTLPGAEVCNGLDDDCDGTVDEDCQACIANGGAGTPWQIHLGEGPRCWGRTFDRHGDPAEYAFATIPPETDSGWRPHAPPRISFDDPSTLCGVCECRAGGDFTYFQTSFYVPATTPVTSLRVTIANVDDGVRVALFNSRYPAGIVDPGAYAYLGGGSTSDLAMYVVPGRNRVVLTHVDDCCMVRRIADATVTLNGAALAPCGP